VHEAAGDVDPQQLAALLVPERALPELVSGLDGDVHGVHPPVIESRP
jgi:hypothetical protein